MKRNAFSLVELSIVLVILGLLTGGILTGQSLIRAAEMRAVTTQMVGYQTALRTFQSKYFALPGDMRNATAFWGDNDAACADAGVTNGTPGTCNGDGNGGIDLLDPGTAGVTMESLQFWNQLALAGLIEGSYTGVTGTAGTRSDIGENIPASKLSGYGYWVRNLGDTSGAGGGSTLTSTFALDYGNVIHSDGGEPFVPEELWNIDKKIDDGRPARGKIVARPWNSDCTDASARTDLDADYALTQTGNECQIYMRQLF